MSLSIHHNMPAINVTRSLFTAHREMGKSVEKLSSGFRINTADDAPADLVQSEKLRSQIEGLEKAIQNVTTTRNVMSIAEGGLGQVQAILRTMRQHAIHAMNSGVTSAEQIAADQTQLDAGMQAIDRILNTTSYAGRKLLDKLNVGVSHGSAKNSANATAAAPAASNVVSTPKTYLEEQLKALLAGKEGQEGLTLTRLPVNTTPQVDEDGNIISDMSFSVKNLAGENGETPAEEYSTLDFAAGTSLTDIVQQLKGVAIPQEELDKLAAMTGDESAVRFGRVGDDISQVELDSAALAHLQSLDDDAAAEYLSGFMTKFIKTEDLAAAELQPLGKKLSERDQMILELSKNLMDMSSGTLGELTLGEGDSAQTYHLADIVSGGAASLEANPEASLQVIDKAIKDIAAQRASIGAMQKYSLDAMEDNLRTQHENLTKTESYLRDTDYAKEMTNYTRWQVLEQVGTQMLDAALQGGRSVLDLIA